MNPGRLLQHPLTLSGVTRSRGQQGEAYHKGEALGGQGSVVGGTVPHTHFHQGVMGPQCAGISDLTDNPVGMVGLSTAEWLPRPPRPLTTHCSLPYCSALMYSLSTGLHSTLPTCTPSRTSSNRRPRFSPVMVSLVPPCRGPVSGDSCRKVEAGADTARSTVPGERRWWVGLQG